MTMRLPIKVVKNQTIKSYNMVTFWIYIYESYQVLVILSGCFDKWFYCKTAIFSCLRIIRWFFCTNFKIDYSNLLVL